MATRIDPALIPLAPNLDFESALWQKGVCLVAGLDEAGRGAWAGPVAAAAVILPANPHILTELNGVRDSKQLTPDRRAELAVVIREKALAWCCSMSSSEIIDTWGIIHATRAAMAAALSGLEDLPQHLLIDALFLPDLSIPQTAILKGDQRSLSIASASILAKTARDELMCEFDQTYPAYGFAAHKGYGTRAHARVLNDIGPCAIHRMSFAPLRK